MLPLFKRWDAQIVQGRPVFFPLIGMTPIEILLTQARDQLAGQESSLNAFRSTAGTLIATGGLVAGLVGTRISSRLSAAGLVFASLAVVAFLLGTVVALRVIAPVAGFRFGENLSSYREWLDEHGSENGADAAFALGLAASLDANRRDNKPRLETAATSLQVSAVLIGAEVACWAIAVLVG